MGAAALIGTLTGFGYALLATPLLVLVLPPRDVVPLVLISSIVLLVLLSDRIPARDGWPQNQPLDGGGSPGDAWLAVTFSQPSQMAQ